VRLPRSTRRAFRAAVLAALEQRYGAAARRSAERAYRAPDRLDPAGVAIRDGIPRVPTNADRVADRFAAML
jgi:hypothetical protein